MQLARPVRRERAVLVGIRRRSVDRRELDEHLEELGRLAECDAQNATVAGDRAVAHRRLKAVLARDGLDLARQLAERRGDETAVARIEGALRSLG